MCQTLFLADLDAIPIAVLRFFYSKPGCPRATVELNKPSGPLDTNAESSSTNGKQRHHDASCTASDRDVESLG
jgi:hypothetical protein